MAAKYALVPADYMTRMKSSDEQVTPVQKQGKTNPPIPELKHMEKHEISDPSGGPNPNDNKGIFGDTQNMVETDPSRGPNPNDNKGTSDDTQNMVEITLLHNKYHNSASIIMNRLKSAGIEINPEGRIIYTDGQLGSNLIDLLKYFLYPKGEKMNRPVDAIVFGMLLKQLNVPDNLLTRSISRKNGDSTRRRKSTNTRNVPFNWKRM